MAWAAKATTNHEEIRCFSKLVDRESAGASRPGSRAAAPRAIARSRSAARPRGPRAATSRGRASRAGRRSGSRRGKAE
jgi:hypothetical protein